VVGEYAEATNLVSRAFQSKSENFTRLKSAKIGLARPPEIHLLEVRLGREEVKPSVVGIGDKQADH
jgi:hypothetical protein